MTVRLIGTCAPHQCHDSERSHRERSPHADCRVTEEEQEHLKALQAKFGMSDDQVAALVAQMEDEKRVADSKN